MQTICGPARPSTRRQLESEAYELQQLIKGGHLDLRRVKSTAATPYLNFQGAESFALGSQNFPFRA